MDKRDVKNRIGYVVACVNEFASRYHLSVKEAYNYLRRFKGVELLLKHYDVMHTLSIDESVENLQIACFKRGGRVQ